MDRYAAWGLGTAELDYLIYLRFSEKKKEPLLKPHFNTYTYKPTNENA